MRVLQSQLAAFSARRTASLPVIAWVVLVFALALFTPPEGAAFDDAQIAPDGLVRERFWVLFLLAVAPLLILRAAQHVAPKAADDTGWLAARAVTNGRIALANWVGTTSAWCAAVLVCAVASEVRTTAADPQTVLRGTVAAPSGRWVTSAEPLVWNATIPASDRALTARLELGLGAGAGSAGAVQLTARDSTDGRATTVATRIGNRGTIEVALPAHATALEFELACSGEGTRACVTSAATELWSPSASRWAAALFFAVHIMLAGATWMALALLFATCVSGTTAACAVLALWIPVWLADLSPTVTRWIPAGDLFEALTIVSDGRAPAWPTLHSALGGALITSAALIATALLLRSWRVSR
ncbi:MAG: hypothetical protein JNL28_17570 [Planctomycetes bacterium]|nr:hypothetical protein [Planctomycetota bacterium]